MTVESRRANLQLQAKAVEWVQGGARDKDGAFSVASQLTSRETYTDAMGSLAFVVKPPRDRVKEFRDLTRKGSLVKFTVDGAPQTPMVVLDQDIVVGDEGVQFSVQCASTLANAMEAGIDPTFARNFSSDAPVADIVGDVMALYGFTNLNIETKRNVALKSGGDVPGFKGVPAAIKDLKRRELKALPGEQAYAFCSKIFTRLGLVMHVSVEAEAGLVLSAPDYAQSATATLVQSSGDAPPGADRMLSPVLVHETNRGQFSEVVVIGSAPDDDDQTFAAFPGFRLGIDIPRPAKNVLPLADLPEKLLDRKAEFYAFRAYRGFTYKPRFINDKESRDVETARRVAYAVFGMHASQGFQIRGTVTGCKTATGRVWTVNTVVNVIIEALGFSQPMWVFERIIRQDAGGGQKTDLTLIPLGSLVIGDPPTGH